MIRCSATLLTILALVACSPDRSPAVDGVQYPASLRTEQTDRYHGVEVADPYRWLEEDIRKSDAVRQWVDRQNGFTFAYLANIGERQAIHSRLQALWDVERYGLPRNVGGRYFYDYNNGLQNHDVVYVQESLQDEPRVLIDPNTWSDDGSIALARYYPSPDGRFVAYLVQDSGSDWHTARVMDLENGVVLEDRLEWLKYSRLAWTVDGSGFYYSRFPAPGRGEKFQQVTENQAVYFHRIGTAQSENALVYSQPEHPEWNYLTDITDNGRYLIITVWKGSTARYQIMYQDLQVDGAPLVTLIAGFEFDYTLEGSLGSEIFLRTNHAATRRRLIAIDLENPEEWREVIPEAADLLYEASIVGGRIICEYKQDARSLVRIFDISGELLGGVDLPGIGSASGFNGRSDDTETFFRFESFATPPTISRLDVVSGEIAVLHRSVMDFDSDDYVVAQVFYHSKDGTRVPMFISHHKDIEPDGDRPTLLYGYGGFNGPMAPTFSTAQLAWMEMGGIYAVAGLRGGGEYGEEWHQAGARLNKQNVFDDFIAAAEYLIAKKYTRPGKLAIFGVSNGGLLVGAVTNQRPDLFAAAIPAVGVMDMLRYQKSTAGRYWVDEYGSAEDPVAFKALYAYSPYHNIRTGTHYPAVLVTTADTDDRVVPSHSFKYAAAMQLAQAGDAPILIRIEKSAGHSAGTATEKVIQDYADRWAFLVQNLDMELPEDYGE